MRPLLLAILSLCVLNPALLAQTGDRPTNVILFISDGCGPASFAMARDYLWHKGGGDLALDAHLVGAIRTHSADSRVTDSAAAGTALASGVKTANFA